MAPVDVDKIVDMLKPVPGLKEHFAAYYGYLGEKAQDEAIKRFKESS